MTSFANMCSKLHRYDSNSFDENDSLASNHPFDSRVRTISFNLDVNRVHFIPHIDDLSPEEIQDTWYGRRDYENMRKRLIPLVQKLMKGETLEENNQVTARGLEFRTREGALRRQHNKHEAIVAVLDEQESQMMNEIWDDERIREVYLMCSSHCLAEAHALGLKDEQETIAIQSNQKEVDPASDDSSEDEIEKPSRSPFEATKARRLVKLFQQVRIRRKIDDLRPPTQSIRVVGPAA